jgi:hypothetical protein
VSPQQGLRSPRPPRRAAALLARGGRLPSDRRLARPSRSANSRARAVACGRKLTAREPAGLRGRVRRRGARSHAAADATCALAALQASHGARYGREAHGALMTPTGTHLPTRSAPPRPRSLHRRRQGSTETRSRLAFTVRLRRRAGPARRTPAAANFGN